MKKKRTAQRKRSGIFIYCSEDLKRRLRSAAALAGSTLSGYVLVPARQRLEADEAKAARKSR
jgi:uncharacterized protein (DUF1778 family)